MPMKTETTPTLEVGEMCRLVELLPFPAALVDCKRSVVCANAPALREFPLLKLGQDVVFGLRNPEALTAVTRALEARQGGVCEFAHGKDATRRLQMQAQPFALTSDTAPLALLTFTETTALHASERVRSTFIANVSHELRSPLTTLISALETLSSTAKTDAKAQTRFFALMNSEAQRMRRLIDDLLSLSELEAHEHIRPEGVVAVPKLLARVSEALAERAHLKGMRIAIRCPDNLPAVTGESEEVREVFENLLDNAIKYGTPDSVIDVHAETCVDSMAGEAVRVAVTNQGSPIPPEHLPRLTERFYRIDKGRSRALGGTGLGLAIVKHILSRHRGRLTITSTAERGTTLTAIFPL